jgi:DUF1680 family protein
MTETTTSFRAGAGPVAPSAGAASAERPLALADVAVTGGIWGEWQERNRDVSLRIAVQRLEDAGNLQNLRIAAGEATGAFTDPVFMDSDVAKTLEAIAWELARRPDPELEEFLHTTTALLARAQEPSGYLDSWGQIVAPGEHFEHLTFSHELYCAGHLIQAAVAAKRAIDDDDLLAVAIRLADHLVDVFLDRGHPGIDGHPEIETALVELYRVTGTESHLRLAAHFVDARGHGTIGHEAGLSYIQDHAPYREVDTLVGHAVRALYLEAGAVDVGVETGDASLVEASEQHWDDTVRTKTSITGGHGSRYAHEAFGDRWELPVDRSYNETCAAIASIQWSWRLLLRTGDARYADLIERTLHNAFAVSTSADGTHFFYANLQQRRSDHLDGEDTGRRHAWFSCACCPPNVMRLVASLGHYLYSTAGDGLTVQQYAPSTAAVQLSGGVLRVRLDTAMPWDGDVAITIDEAPDAEVALRLRVPSWADGIEVRIDGAAETVPVADGYLQLRRAWRPGQRVEVRFGMPSRVVRPHHRIDALRGSVALERGPLVYAFEQVDQRAGVDVEEVLVDAGAAPRVVRHGDRPGIGGTVALEVDVVRTATAEPAGLPFGEGAAVAPVGEPDVAVAIPYFQWDNRDGGAMRIWVPERIR